MKKIKILSLCLILIAAIVFSLSSCNAKESDNFYAGGVTAAPEKPGDPGSIDANIGSSIKDPSEYERKIIRTVNISTQTLKFDESVALVEELCQTLGGYIESSSVSGNGINSRVSSRYANYTIRIPAENLDGFNDGVGEILKITSSSSNSDEVTNTYYDIKSRIEVLEMEKEALTKLYEQYTDYGNIGYLIEIQDKLYNVIAEIEAYETQIRLYDSKIAYSTVYLSIREVEEYVEVKETFGEKILGALEGGWDAFAKVCSFIAIAFVACLPFIITGGVIAIGIVVLVKSIKKKNRNKGLHSEQNDSEE